MTDPSKRSPRRDPETREKVKPGTVEYLHVAQWDDENAIRDLRERVEKLEDRLDGLERRHNGSVLEINERLEALEAPS